MSTDQPQLSEACCNTPPTKAVYQHQGEDKVLPVTINGENLKTYRTGPKNAKIGIIGAYDILGFTPTTYRFYDTLARSHGGYQISIPHYFKRENLPGNAMPDRTATMGMIHKYGSYKESHVDEIILAAIEDLRADGCESFVMYGQCWGAWIAVLAAGDERMPFLGTGGVHPSLITQELISKARCPLILMPAKDDDDMAPFIESMKEKNFKVESFHHRFETMIHGFTGARGDYDDPTQRAAILEAIEMFANFTDKVVAASRP